jgi:ABC-type glycerol-3-phosphate transport system substrate-binding protein
MEWNFSAPEDGLYKLDIRFKQDLVDGAYSSRKIYIDGSIPFKEFEAISFAFKREWQMAELADNGGIPYEIYLSKGEHTIRIENTLGSIANVISVAQQAVVDLNSVYRQVLMYVGAVPDAQRDYKVSAVLPELAGIMRANGEALYKARDELDGILGNKSTGTSALDALAFQITQFADDPNIMPVRMKVFRDNISNLALWVLLSSEQSLTIDYMQFMPVSSKKLVADAPWYAKVWHEMQAFVASFFVDYSVISTDASASSKREVTIWFGAGRDQASVLKTLVDTYFTPFNDEIKINLRLVDMSILLRAVAAGKGPDVVLFEPQEQPLNYALRKAILDLAQFPDIDNVLKRFNPAAVEPFRYGTSVYALPETQGFPVMFYRKDILSALNQKVPSTWDDMYDIMTVLKNNHLDVGFPSVQTAAQAAVSIGDISFFTMILFQNGGQLYNQEKSRLMLDEPVAIDAFIKWSELYTKYKIPQQVDLTTRFRTGECPIVITSFGFFNTLNIAAPEIRGLWDFTAVPGTVKPDGSIDRSAASSASACGIMRNTKDKEAAWEVLKWWTSAEIQTLYGQEIENVQGPSGRWATANLEAFDKLPWTTKDAKTINQQREWVKAIPEVPGGYFTGRNINNAIRAVLNDGAYPRETLLDWTQQTNDEITLKRKEFGY